MILVCGEALVDLFLADAQGAEIPGRAVAGGSPFNVAIGLSRLGRKSGFLGGLSTDHFGRHLTGLLAREGVNDEYAVRSGRLTTISVIATDASGSPSYSFHGEGAADRMLTAGDLPPALPDTITALTFGSYTLAVEPAGSAYLALAQREKGRRVISLDPNVRPSVVGDITRWRHRFDAFLDCATLVKASEEDIETAYGTQANLHAIAADWLARGPKLVIVTRGGAGAVAFHANGAVTVPARTVAVLDTVGAGDTFHAAVLARLDALGMLTPAKIATLDNEALRNVMRYAVIASSITCSRRGADLPTSAEVEAHFV